MISACETSKNLNKALQLFQEMQQEDITPDAITYNALISACEERMDLEQDPDVVEAECPSAFKWLPSSYGGFLEFLSLYFSSKFLRCSGMLRLHRNLAILTVQDEA